MASAGSFTCHVRARGGVRDCVHVWALERYIREWNAPAVAAQRTSLMSVMGYDAEICGLPPTATQDKKGFRFYASRGEAQQAFMEAEQISFAEFQRIFDSVDMVHAYS